MKIVKKDTSIIIIITICITFFLLLSGCIYKIPKDPNTFNRTIIYDGLTRTYLIHIPPSLPKNSSPALVFVLHGGGGTGENMERSLTLGGFNKLADEYKFIVVYPDGIDRHWNDGRTNVSDRAHLNNIDDVGFIKTLIENLTIEFKIDPNRIYSTGISNGAMMSYRLAFDIPDKIAAIAPVAGAIPIDLIKSNNSVEPISVCIISGTHDPLVPWEGGFVGFPRNPRGTVISVEDSVMHWVNNNNCNITPNITWLDDINKRDRTQVRLDIYSNGDNNTEVFLYEIKKGGHTWPDGYQYFPKIIVGRTCRDIDANIVIWDFFNNHPKY
jgi:polyhydroxybutyrate depolymerase